MPMMCAGPHLGATPVEGEAAQIRAVQLFTANFLKRYPDGIVLSELEHMGVIGFPPKEPGPIIIPGKPWLNEVLRALTADFRRWVKDRDYRKCDALGINGSATIGELLEVTTVTRASRAIEQLGEKLETLRAVNRMHNLRVEWLPARWWPYGDQMFYQLRTANPNPAEVRYVCFFPTIRLPAPPGIVLYEIHALQRPLVPVPVQVPKETTDRLRLAYQANKPLPGQEPAWGERFVRENPNIAVILQGLAYALGAALVIVAIVLAFDPIPGDEALAAAAAMALLAFAAQKAAN